MNKKILKVIICPICKKKLFYNKKSHEVICKLDNLAFPINNDIIVLMESKARKIN